MNSSQVATERDKMIEEEAKVLSFIRTNAGMDECIGVAAATIVDLKMGLAREKKGE